MYAFGKEIVANYDHRKGHTLPPLTERVGLGKGKERERIERMFLNN
jgi:hypothetical protein